MTISIRLNEKEEIMLEEIKKFYNTTEEGQKRPFSKSEVIRYLIFTEYNEIRKEIK